jgi:hypothetical protein
MGYKGTNKEFQWTAAPNLTHANEVIEEFHQRYPAKPSSDHFAPDHDARVTRCQGAAKQCKALRAQA